MTSVDFRMAVLKKFITSVDYTHPTLSNLTSQYMCVFFVVCFWQIQCSVVVYRRKFVHF